jgi:acyl carrier protein
LDDIEFIENDTDLIEAGVLDSLLMVMLVDFCEGEFDSEIDLEDLTDDNFRSLNAIAEFVVARAR